MSKAFAKKQWLDNKGGKIFSLMVGAEGGCIYTPYTPASYEPEVGVMEHQLTTTEREHAFHILLSVQNLISWGCMG